MSLYILTKSGIQIDLDQKMCEIREDLIYNNASELSNRREYYTRKYRGNRISDVNVGIWDNTDNSITVQLFVRNKEGYIKEQYKIKRLGQSTLVEFI